MSESIGANLLSHSPLSLQSCCFQTFKYKNHIFGAIVGSVIQATRMVEFEDGLKRGTSLKPKTAFIRLALYLRSKVPFDCEDSSMARQNSNFAIFTQFMVLMSVQLLLSIRNYNGQGGTNV